MRTYRLQMRLIQLGTVFGFVVLIAGFFGVWGLGGNGLLGESGAGSSSQAGSTSQTESTSPTKTLANTKIVALGDSFTYGYPLDAAHSWTQRLADVLKVTVVNKGKMQQTAKDLLSRFDTDVVAEKPGRVIIFAGIGDAIQEVPLKEVQDNIQAMVEKAKSNHIIPILVLPFNYPGYQQSIKDIRDWELNYAQSQTIVTLDFSPQLFDSAGKYLSGLSDNNKYPNAKGYETMGDYAAGVLK